MAAYLYPGAARAHFLTTWRLLHQSFIHSQSFNVELARPENLTSKFENICLLDEKKKKKKKKMKTGRLSRHSFYSLIYSHLKQILLNGSGECWPPLHSHVIIPKPHWRCHSVFPVWLQDWWDWSCLFKIISNDCNDFYRGKVTTLPLTQHPLLAWHCNCVALVACPAPCGSWLGLLILLLPQLLKRHPLQYV